MVIPSQTLLDCLSLVFLRHSYLTTFTGNEQSKTIKKWEMLNKIMEKGYKNIPLADEQKRNN